MLSTTSPSLIKLIKTADPSYLDEKPTRESDIKEIVTKYEEKNQCDLEKQVPNHVDTPFSCKREGVDIDMDAPMNFELEMINSKNKEQCPVINFNKNCDSLNFEEHIFDPVTERECSFINNISVNHSDFLEEEENKNPDVVLCISNLDIDTGFGKKIYFNTNLNTNNVLQSEEKLMNKKELESLNNELKDEKKNEKSNLINNEKKGGSSLFRYFKKLILCISFLLFLSIISGIIYFIIKNDV